MAFGSYIVKIIYMKIGLKELQRMVNTCLLYLRNKKKNRISIILGFEIVFSIICNYLKVNTIK